jgi:hypothetical protein
MSAMTEALGAIALWVLLGIAMLAVMFAPLLAGFLGWGGLVVQWVVRRHHAVERVFEKVARPVVQHLPRMRGVMRLRTLLVILLVIFAWFVWPTPYRDLSRYEHINRFTGAMCPLSQMCWLR